MVNESAKHFHLHFCEESFSRRNTRGNGFYFYLAYARKTSKMQNATEIPSSSRNCRPNNRAVGIRDVTWKLFMTSLFEVRISRNEFVGNIDANQTPFGENGERISFNNMTVTFHGDSNTYLYLFIRMPTGAMRVAWDADVLIIDERYRIAPQDFTTWPRSDLHCERPTPYFVELFGQRSDKTQIIVADQSYMIRSERDYPSIVMPYSEYKMIQLSLLRDFNRNLAVNARPRRRRPECRRHRGSDTSVLSPCTPNSNQPSTESEHSSRVYANGSGSSYISE